MKNKFYCGYFLVVLSVGTIWQPCFWMVWTVLEFVLLRQSKDNFSQVYLYARVQKKFTKSIKLHETWPTKVYDVQNYVNRYGN